jgi:hypothetical protein
MSTRTRPLSRWLAAALLAAFSWLHATAFAGAEPPGRVGRVADAVGDVWVYDEEQGQWEAAFRNRPLVEGDRVSTGPGGRAELRIGSTVLRLDGGTDVEMARLDDEQMGFALQRGSLALRVRSREVANEIEVLTPEARLRPAREGHYRIDREGDTTWASTWRGEWRVDDRPVALAIGADRRVELWRDGTGRLLSRWMAMAEDEFSQRVAREDRDEDGRAAERYASPEMTGLEDLDRYGRWDRHPEFGAVWFPFAVAVDWAPYRYGRWTWLRPWGWTWVDDAPWGFAPSHYGRWVQWRGRWCWTPGAYARRPVFTPALVAWVGPPQVVIGVTVGNRPPLPGARWKPLAPRQQYVPPPPAHLPPPWERRRDHDGDRRSTLPAPVPRGPSAQAITPPARAWETLPPRRLDDARPNERPVDRRGADVAPPGQRGAWIRPPEPAPTAAPVRPAPAAPAMTAAPAAVVRPPEAALPEVRRRDERGRDPREGRMRDDARRDRPPPPATVAPPATVVVPRPTPAPVVAPPPAPAPAVAPPPVAAPRDRGQDGRGDPQGRTGERDPGRRPAD